MKLPSQRTVFRYGVAVVATAAAVFLRELLLPLWGTTLPFLTFYPAVMVASWYGGLGAGLFATLLSGFSAFYFFLPPRSVTGTDVGDLVGFVLFILFNAMIAFLSEKLHRTVRGAQADAARLKESEEQLDRHASEWRALSEKLQEAERRKDDFLATLAHELRTPLSSIAGGAHILHSTAANDDARRRAIEVIERQTRYMSRLVEDLLDISRIGCGKLEIVKESLDLGALARETVSDFSRIMETTNLTISVEVSETPLWVNGDRTRIAQMLTNLLQNSAKFTNPGGQITVRIHSDGSQRRAIVSVIDTGVGIDPDLLPHIFNAYSQGSHAASHSKGGLGLGLALVKSLAELQGGDVQASSPGKGHGSEIRFSLPLTKISRASVPTREITVIADVPKPSVSSESPERKQTGTT